MGYTWGRRKIRGFCGERRKEWSGRSRPQKGAAQQSGISSDGIAGGVPEVLGLAAALGALYIARRTRRAEEAWLRVYGSMEAKALHGKLNEILSAVRRLDRMEKPPADQSASAGRACPADRGGPAEAAASAERESELSRAMEEGVMNLLQYAAGKVPGVEVSM